MTFEQHVHKRINQMKDEVSINIKRSQLKSCPSLTVPYLGGIKAVRNLERFKAVVEIGKRFCSN